ncbi:hypothetical protein SBW75_31225, partial [Pseudomonas aeruginosa]|nr:hypothetical protein [Pseudomonas aeruginosa]
PQNDVTLKMPAFEWVHVQLHQQKGMISLSPPTICNSAVAGLLVCAFAFTAGGFRSTHDPVGWESSGGELHPDRQAAQSSPPQMSLVMSFTCFLCV